MDDKCECKDCNQCTDTITAMKKSPLQLLRYLLCTVDEKYLKLKCVQGDKCGKIDCGVYKFVLSQ